MNAAKVRSLVAVSVIIVGLCVGGYAVVVVPMKRELALAKAQAAEAGAAIERTAELRSTLPEMIRRRDLAERRLILLREASRVARDEGVLYSEVSAAAADIGLRVTRLGPVGEGRRTAGGTRSVRWALEVTGSYGELAMFIEQLEERVGFALVRSVVITPDQTRAGTVAASIETEHFVVDLPGSSDAQ